MGVIRYLLEHDKIQHEYVRDYTNASLIVREDYGFEDGLFSGYDEANKKYNKSSWMYELDANGHALRDLNLKHPRCVLNMLEQHVERYTPEVITDLCGTPKEDFLEICGMPAETAARNKTATFLYALGWTHHTSSAQMIRGAAMIQLLLGNMGMSGGGVNALRGDFNIRGYTNLGLLSLRLPGYMNLPTKAQTSMAQYLVESTPAALQADQINYYKNTPKFFVSLMKDLWGANATAENQWGYDWLPKSDRNYDVF
jgi:anaerobic selenocysteine-containing dehydrogenase